MNQSNLCGSAFRRPWIVTGFVILVATLLITMVPNLISVDEHPNAEWYIKLAEGRISEVERPYSGRILAPMIVYAAKAVLGKPDVQALFASLSFISLIVFIGGVTVILGSATTRPALSFFVLVTPLTVYWFRNYCYPEMFYSALLALFFLTMLYEKWLPSILILFLLMLTREDTIILSCCLAVIFLLRKDMRKLAGLVIIATLAGVIVITLVSSGGKSNIHGTSHIVYLLLKAPYNLLKNYFGIELWTNTLAHGKLTAHSFREQPIWFMELPRWLQAGQIKKAGIYQICLDFPLSTLKIMLTMFGLMPSLLIGLLLTGRQRWKDCSPFMATLISLGLISFLAGPCLGADVERLVSYGWPAFWIATPILIATNPSISTKAYYILAWSFVLCWIPWLVQYFGILNVFYIIFIAAVIHFVVVRSILRTASVKGAAKEPSDSWENSPRPLRSRR